MINQNWLDFVGGKTDEVTARVKVKRAPSEVLTLRNETGFIKVVFSTNSSSEFVGCEAHISILRNDEYLAPAVLSRKNQKLWRVLRWRFALEIASFNADAVRDQTSRLLQLAPRHLTSNVTSTGRFYLLTRQGRVCIRRDIHDGEVSLSVEGMPPAHPLVMVRRGQPLMVKVRRNGFEQYETGTPEHSFMEALKETLIPAAAAA